MEERIKKAKMKGDFNFKTPEEEYKEMMAAIKREEKK